MKKETHCAICKNRLNLWWNAYTNPELKEIYRLCDSCFHDKDEGRIVRRLKELEKDK